jgi:uncharacterized protein
MENFTPWSSTLGGVLIGLSAALVMLFQGRIAGISGILGGLLGPRPGEVAWRLWFVVGLVLGGTGMFLLQPDAFAVDVQRSPLAIVIAGLIVGFSTRLGSGCTSGHGVCGISRMSRRSIVATCVFIATGMLTATAITRLLGGTL